MRSRRRRRFIAGILIGVCIGVSLCLAYSFNLLSGVQLQSSDFLYKVASPNRDPAQQDKIVIVAIDDRSLEQLGHFPSWPRSYHADVIDMLTEAEARIIVFDILFSDPAPGDEQLAMSISDAGNVILPVAYSPTSYKSTGAGDSNDSGSFIRSLSVFEEGALAAGHANLLPDVDGVVRKSPLVIYSHEQSEPSLSLAAVATYLRRPQIIEAPPENGRLPFAGRSIPLDDVNGMIINYTGAITDNGQISSFETVSFLDALRGEVAPAVFYDKIVIIGATASALGDTFWTPTGRMMNGVEIHASAIDTILSGDFLRPASSAITIALIMTLAALCSMVVLRFRVLWATLLAFLLFGAYVLIAFSMFDRGIMFNMVYPPLAIIGTFIGVNLFSITSERAEKRAITETFGRYISPPVVDRILTALERDELKLGGQQQEATVAFADIRGFTSMSENMQTDELVKVLNIYLSIVINAVLDHNGMVNKFGGDSVMAVWNAPTPCEEHALLATKAAIEVQHQIKELQHNNALLPKIDFGIGINTGIVIAGNMGSEARLEYSVVGDAVNIAARLTSLAEGGKVWIGSNTFELIKERVVAEELEPLTVKGKREPIKAYEVRDICEESTVEV